MLNNLTKPSNSKLYAIFSLDHKFEKDIKNFKFYNFSFLSSAKTLNLYSEKIKHLDRFLFFKLACDLV